MPKIGKRGISAFTFTMGEFVPANHARKSTAVECDIEVITPEAGFLVQSFDRMLIDVDAVEPTASEAVCMSVGRLKHLLEAITPKISLWTSSASLHC